METVFAKKIGMARIYDDSGKAVSVTVLEVPENTVTQVKSKEKDGYEAVQLGAGVAKNLTKPLAGHVKKSGVTPLKLREVRLEAPAEAKVGEKVTLSIFTPGDTLAVSGLTKGKGFSGTVKRHNFKTGPKSHGSHNYRKIGSIGSAFPEHVIKGKRMPGRYGGTQVTIKNLKVAGVMADKNLLLVTGAVPGPNKAFLMVKKTKSAPEAKTEAKAEASEE